MLVWLVAEDGTYVDETNVDAAPKTGDTITTDRAYQILDMPDQDENAKKLDAQVLVVKQA
jgi:hypothetical protein